MGYKQSWNRAKKPEQKRRFREGHAAIFEERKLNGGGCSEHDFQPLENLPEYSRCVNCGRTVKSG